MGTPSLPTISASHTSFSQLPCLKFLPIDTMHVLRSFLPQSLVREVFQEDNTRAGFWLLQINIYSHFLPISHTTSDDTRELAIIAVSFNEGYCLQSRCPPPTRFHTGGISSLPISYPHFHIRNLEFNKSLQRDLTFSPSCVPRPIFPQFVDIFSHNTVGLYFKQPEYRGSCIAGVLMSGEFTWEFTV